MLRIAKQKGQMCKTICVELESDQMVKRHFIREHKEQNMPQDEKKNTKSDKKGQYGAAIYKRQETWEKLGCEKMNFQKY